ncbi:MAG: hypothetical protein HY360_25010 [Verrucomicrobia bacterium]|nr:hypothetical protein [Verrucomicrobiota bacterium]
MSVRDHISLWVTPKIFDALDEPLPGVRAFYDHYAPMIRRAAAVTVNFCAGNGDHILNFRGPEFLSDAFGEFIPTNCLADFLRATGISDSP